MNQKYLRHFRILVITLLFCYPASHTFASYEPVDGRLSFLAGLMINTNFQETFFNNNDSESKLGRSQSFAALLQVLGDLNAQSSLMAELTLGAHKFYKETDLYLDEFKLEAVSFDLGYRRNVYDDFWVSAQLGSMYPWRITQDVESQPYRHSDSEFTSIYSIILGIQYESEWNQEPVSYDFRIRKYMSGQLDDQMSIGLGIGWRFGI